MGLISNLVPGILKGSIEDFFNKNTSFQQKIEIITLKLLSFVAVIFLATCSSVIFFFLFNFTIHLTFKNLYIITKISISTLMSLICYITIFYGLNFYINLLIPNFERKDKKIEKVRKDKKIEKVKKDFKYKKLKRFDFASNSFNEIIEVNRSCLHIVEKEKLEGGKEITRYLFFKKGYFNSKYSLKKCFKNILEDIVKANDLIQERKYSNANILFLRALCKLMYFKNYNYPVLENICDFFMDSVKCSFSENNIEKFKRNEIFLILTYNVENFKKSGILLFSENNIEKFKVFFNELVDFDTYLKNEPPYFEEKEKELIIKLQNTILWIISDFEDNKDFSKSLSNFRKLTAIPENKML